MKIYLVQWGFYSCDNGSNEIAAIYSTYEKAQDHIKTEICDFKNLKQSKNKKTGELIDLWSDGDYWVSIGVGYLDSPALYLSKEECEKLSYEN